jgi:long-chain acyl-CoA synthetase
MNLAAVLLSHPEDRSALILEDGAEMTYGALVAAASEMRARLSDSGVVAGDRVVMVLGNDPAFVISYLAILGVGAVAVPLNPASPASELRRQVADVRPVALVVNGTVVNGTVANTRVANAGLSGDVAAVAGDSGIALVAPVEAGHAGGPAAGPPVVDREPDDLAVLMFTAGTGGSPKPAMLSHGNLLANLQHLDSPPGELLADDVILGSLPFFHIFGLNVVLGGALYVGAPVVLVEQFHGDAALHLITRCGVTVLVGSPTMYAALEALPDPPANARALERVRVAYCGAAPLTADVASAWERRFGQPLRQGYGLTEASPAVTRPSINQHPRPDSIGAPLPGVEVRLVDEDGDDSLAGDPGEIWVRGANVFSGYWGDRQATAEVLTPDGWLRTGDVAVAGDDGQLYMVDRAKDLVIVSGFNVYPAEVEETLAQHPAVAEVAVVGAPDSFRGETVKAFVVARQDHQVTEEELSRFCADHLVGYKCPSSISLVPSLPHGLAGKLLRRALMEQAAEGRPDATAEPGGWR